MNLSYRIIGALLLILFGSFGTFANQIEPAATTAQTQTEKPAEEAEESESYWEIEFGFIVGVGKSSLNSLNQSERGNLINEPWFSGGYYNGNFFIESDPANGKPFTLGYTAYETDTLQINTILTPFFVGFDEEHQKRGDMLTGLGNRNGSLDAGIEILSTHKFGQIGFRALRDVVSAHGGFALATAYSYPVYLDKMVIWPSVTVTYASSEVNNHFFGIRPSEVRPDRPLYTAGSGFIAKMAFYLEYELTDRTNLIGFSHYTKTSSDIHQSPLVSRNYSFAAGMGVIWIF